MIGYTSWLNVASPQYLRELNANESREDWETDESYQEMAQTPCGSDLTQQLGTIAIEGSRIESDIE